MEMENSALLNAIKNIQNIFTIILGLSLTEAFKQLVTDRGGEPDRGGENHEPFWRGFRIKGFFYFYSSIDSIFSRHE